MFGWSTTTESECLAGPLLQANNFNSLLLLAIYPLVLANGWMAERFSLTSLTEQMFPYFSSQFQLFIHSLLFAKHF